MTSVHTSQFESIRAALSAADRPARPNPGDPTPVGEASVSIVLRSTAPLEVLLVRRALSDRDPWSGHMALPGGRRDAQDRSGLETAIRETHEECGLLLTPEAGLGQLAAVSPQSPKLPTLRVTPYVFGVEADAAARVASAEIDAVFWVSLDELTAPENQRIVQVPLIGALRDFPSYAVAGETVWGMTYRVLSRFLAHYTKIG